MWRLLAVTAFLAVCLSATASDRKYIVNPRPGDTKALPFSDAVLAGNTLYIAGHIGLDPKTNQAPADPELEAHQEDSGKCRIYDGRYRLSADFLYRSKAL